MFDDYLFLKGTIHELTDVHILYIGDILDVSVMVDDGHILDLFEKIIDVSSVLLAENYGRAYDHGIV